MEVRAVETGKAAVHERQREGSGRGPLRPINTLVDRRWTDPLRRLGFDPSDVRWVVMTHLHTDHAGGLGHFPNSEILVSRVELEQASGTLGKLRGYLPHRWPQWFRPREIEFSERPFGPFPRSQTLTEAGDGVAPNASAAVRTLARINALASERPTVFLPSHDPCSEERLAARRPVVALGKS